MKHCPKCYKEYDDTWGVCFNYNCRYTELVSGASSTAINKNLENKDAHNQAPSNGAKKKPWGLKEWLFVLTLAVIAGLFVYGLYDSTQHPERYASANGSTEKSQAEMQVATTIFFMMLGGIWWAITKIWPVLSFLFFFGLVAWGLGSIIKDAVKDGVSEALQDLIDSDDFGDKIEKAIRKSKQPKAYTDYGD